LKSFQHENEVCILTSAFLPSDEEQQIELDKVADHVALQVQLDTLIEGVFLSLAVPVWLKAENPRGLGTSVPRISIVTVLPVGS